MVLEVSLRRASPWKGGEEGMGLGKLSEGSQAGAPSLPAATVAEAGGCCCFSCGFKSGSPSQAFPFFFNSSQGARAQVIKSAER